MADQPDENTKDFSMEELNVWNVEKLRKYLRNRGIAIANDTQKPDLFLKVYHASRLHLPLCNTKEQRRSPNCSRKKREALYWWNFASFHRETGQLAEGKPLFSWHDDEWHGSVLVEKQWHEISEGGKKIYMKADMSLMLSTISYQIVLSLLCTWKSCPANENRRRPENNRDNALFRFSFCPLGTP